MAPLPQSPGEQSDAVIIKAACRPGQPWNSALKYRLPALSNQKSLAEAGALTSYSASFAERARGIASYVDKILKGAKPGDLPIQQPTKFELIINLKAAKSSTSQSRRPCSPAPMR